jgi:hypothetical protein
MLYRCKRNVPLGDLNPDQFKRVQDFFDQFDPRSGAHPGLYQTFSTTKSFENLLLDNLQKLLLEYKSSSSPRNASPSQKRDCAKIFVCYKRSARKDRELAEYLSDYLANDGHDVFIDASLRVGTKWLKEIDEQILSSDYLIVLVSKDSADSEMVQAEILRAYEYRNQNGRPQIIPVRIDYEGLLPYTISAFLGQYQQAFWNSNEDNLRVAEEISSAVGGRAETKTMLQTSRSAPLSFSEDGRALYTEAEQTQPLSGFDPRLLDELDEPGGSIRLGDRFYIERESDARLTRAIIKTGETITISASRQTGKSSLLARGLHHAHPTADIVYMDLQSIAHQEFESADRFLRYFASTITRKLRKEAGIVSEIWQEHLGAQDKLVKVMEEHVLPVSSRQVVLAIDEADRLLSVPFHSDFFALMRSWHNNRAIDPVWNRINLVMVIATEPYLLISNPNQSPFNVGVKLNLADFNREQVQDLNQRHARPVADKDLEAFFGLLNGHPYLTRKALYLLVSERWTWERLYDRATDDQGPFADHLRRQLWFIREEAGLQDALRQILRDRRCDDDKILWRLLRAGLVKGTGDLYDCRCGLYARYFREHLK